MLAVCLRDQQRENESRGLEEAHGSMSKGQEQHMIQGGQPVQLFEQVLCRLGARQAD
jgi:hypothetical protein